jgi:tRNA:m4X modification enzyme
MESLGEKPGKVTQALHDPPKPPDDWTRCQCYVTKKHRFCRQVRLRDSKFCGNHAVGVLSSKKRIPCPLDPSHDILEDHVEKHLAICPMSTRLKELESRSYFQRGINDGGHGDLGFKPPSDFIRNSDWAQRIAIKVLEIYERLLMKREDFHSPRSYQEISTEQIYQAIPTNDLSQPEIEGGLSEAVEMYRIKIGGSKHLHQHASLLGHLRLLTVLPLHPSEALLVSQKDNKDNPCILEILEMGAGRGILGLLTAGIAAAEKYGDNQVYLTLVERNGARSKADTVLRKAKGFSAYMKLNTINWNRIQCDLSHIHVPSILSNIHEANDSVSGNKRKHPLYTRKLVVVAKHLCGAGTDLALKSLGDLNVDVCILATCCHGVCTWDSFVGRDFLIAQFGSTSFGAFEFELLRKWSSGTVAQCKNSADDHHIVEVDEHYPCSSAAIVRALHLRCGIQGLGRACQRLLDAARCNYMEEILFKGSHDVSLCHYVDSEVTPQNAVIVAKRKISS